MIEADTLTVRYGDRLALDSVSLSVGAGEWHGVLGPNGSGKSTLFRVLATLLRPNSGSFSIGGKTNPAHIRPQLGVVFQQQSLDRKLTVAQNMTAQGNLYGLSGPSLRQKIVDLLTLFGLEARLNDAIDSLSGGLQRRVEIAKALLSNPAVLLLDEPSTGLDPIARRDLLHLLTQIRAERQLTIVVTTHLLEEAELCGQLTLLHEGRIATSGTPAALKAQLGGDVVEFSTSNPAAFAARFPDLPSQSGPGFIRFETPEGARFAASAADTAPIDAIAIRKPTLEDVFFRHTGARL